MEKMSYPSLQMRKGSFKTSEPCKAAGRKKFKWPSAYGSAWAVRCTKAGGPGNMGKSKKAQEGDFADDVEFSSGLDFSMSKEMQDQSDAAYAKASMSNREATMDKRDEKEVDRLIRRSRRKAGRKKYAGMTPAEIYQAQLRKKANRGRGNRRNAFGPRRINRRRKPTGGKGNAGCQGAGCGAYE